MRALLDFIRRDVSVNYRKLFFLTTISGLANAAILSLINVAAQNAANEKSSHRYLLLFLIVMVIYVITQKFVMVTTTQEVEQVLHRIRVRLIREVRLTGLMELEKIGGQKIYTTISGGMVALSNTAVYLAMAWQSAVLIVFVLIYITSLSVVALVVCLLFSAIGGGIHLLRGKRINAKFQEAMQEELRLHESVADMVQGFKEVKVSSARGDEILKWIDHHSVTASAAKAEAQRLYANDFIMSQVTFFLLTASMAFLVPMFGGDAYDKVVIKLTAATLFAIGPVSSVITTIPIIARARVVLEDILKLEERLKGAQLPAPQGEWPVEWSSEIRFEGVTFRYENNGNGGGFQVGPLNLSFKRGETVFITGGNGSGKTTLIRLLTGLYRPSAGRITVDGVPIENGNLVAYRNLFAVVFSDNHLSRRLYGIEEVSMKEVSKLLEILELKGKTRLVDREFDTIALSSGQRKRLALLASVLEHKPLSLFDEWAADQDPHFRKKFYFEILDWLKRQGSTIVAVTHDDRYYHLADRVIVMREGRVVEGEMS